MLSSWNHKVLPKVRWQGEAESRRIGWLCCLRSSHSSLLSLCPKQKPGGELVGPKMFCSWRYWIQLRAVMEISSYKLENVQVYILAMRRWEPFSIGVLNIQKTAGPSYTLQAGDCRILLWRNMGHKKGPIDIVSNIALLGRWREGNVCMGGGGIRELSPIIF